MQRIYKKCDRCGADGFDEDVQLFEISVQCKNLTTNSMPIEAFPKQQWCKECVSITALLGISEREAEERRQKSLGPVVPATFEDMVREIAQEIAEDAVSNNNCNR